MKKTEVTSHKGTRAIVKIEFGWDEEKWVRVGREKGVVGAVAVIFDGRRRCTAFALISLNNGHESETKKSRTASIELSKLLERKIK
jgi:hypothetical protein